MNVLNDNGFIFITAAFKKGINEFICKPEPFSLSTKFLIFFQFPITSFSSFLCTPPKHCCITRMFFNELFHFESMKQISKVLSQEKFKGTSHQCIDIKLTICLMCHTSLCHNNKGMLWPIFCIDINTHSDRN